MAQSWISAQKNLNDFLTVNYDKIKAYKGEMEAMMLMPDKSEEEQLLRFQRKREIITEYLPMLETMEHLEQERELAYHEQEHPTAKPDLLHQTKLVDLDHPDNPYGEERQREDWKPGGRDGRVYVPGGHQESKKVILLPN